MNNAFTRWLADRINSSKFVRRRLERAPDFIIGNPDDPYMHRWYLIRRNRWLNVYLHVFLKSDDDRAMHDHPWWSVSLALQGRMLEWIKPKPNERHLGDVRIRDIEAGSVVLRSAEFAHILELPKGQDRPAITIFVTGPVIREWGFHCQAGWRHWKDFTAPGKKGQVGRGCE